MRLWSFTFAVVVCLLPGVEAAGLPQRFVVVVRDENQVPVAGARVALLRSTGELTARGETDSVGRRELAVLSSGRYRLRVEKPGFYVVTEEVEVREGSQAEVTLNRVQEFREVVEVVAPAESIEPAETAAREQLPAAAIFNVPYATTRDIRNALPLLPGVLPAPGGQASIAGGAPESNQIQLDGFNITHPAFGLFTLRVSTDAVRSLEVHAGRASAEEGKAGGGIVAMSTGMGDDRFRFAATDFIPSVQNRKGLNLNNWTPRTTFSGPLRRGQAWFYNAFDGEYGIDIVEELPEGADRSTAWRIGNLAKVQINLQPGHALTASFLLNRSHVSHAGLTPFNPQEITLRADGWAWWAAMREQSYFAGGTLLELGWAVSEYDEDARPQGELPHLVRPGSTAGNFFRTSRSRAQRQEWQASVAVPPMKWRGEHQMKLGTSFERARHRRGETRRPVVFLRADDTLLREIRFAGAQPAGEVFRLPVAFVQDRWSPRERLVVELGLRFEGVPVGGPVFVLPRFAASYFFDRPRETKLVAGVGLYSAPPTAELLTRPDAGLRFDQFFAADGVTPAGAPMVTFFRAAPENLKAPRMWQWSAGIHHRLPGNFILRLEYLGRRGREGLVYVPQPGGAHELRNARRDRYDAFHLAVQRSFRGGYQFFSSYTRSRARSNAILDYSPDLMLFSPQTGGRQPWDVPNRLLVWGWLPLIWRIDLGYSLDWRTGYPFHVVNNQRQSVEPPHSRRLPDYFSLNAHLERRFRIAGGLWALRGGFDNLTGRRNPTSVDNNADSPTFLTFGGRQSRALIGRVRFLGRK